MHGTVNSLSLLQFLFLRHQVMYTSNEVYIGHITKIFYTIEFNEHFQCAFWFSINASLTNVCRFSFTSVQWFSKKGMLNLIWHTQPHGKEQRQSGNDVGGRLTCGTKAVNIVNMIHVNSMGTRTEEGAGNWWEGKRQKVGKAIIGHIATLIIAIAITVLLSLIYSDCEYESILLNLILLNKMWRRAFIFSSFVIITSLFTQATGNFCRFLFF